MKTFYLKPGFEFIFAFSLIIILGLPPVLLAQTNKELEIKIENGDTTINGKNIKQLSAADRETALSDINHINNAPTDKRPRHIFLRRDDTLSGVHMDMPRREGGMHPPMVMRDSVRHRELAMTYKRRMKSDMMGDMPPPAIGMRGPMGRFDRHNTQSFDYVNTDNDGVATHVRFRVAEASDDDLKKMPYIEGAKFEIKDLNIVPEFSTGKTLLMFSLLSKAPAEVKLSDSEGKMLFSEKTTNGNFSKSVVLGLNGIYYLQIKQGNSFALRKIMKEE